MGGGRDRAQCFGQRQHRRCRRLRARCGPRATRQAIETFFGGGLPVCGDNGRPGLARCSRLIIAHPLGTRRPRHHRPGHIVAGGGRRGSDRTDA